MTINVVMGLCLFDNKHWLKFLSDGEDGEQFCLPLSGKDYIPYIGHKLTECETKELIAFLLRNICKDEPCATKEATND